MRFRTATALLLTATMAACDGTGVVSPNPPLIGRSGSTSVSLQIVGTWRRTVFFLDDFNFARSSETSFQFLGDGTFIRVQIARNHTLGLFDVLTSAGRWRLTGTLLTIDYVTPSPARVDLEARITGDELLLAGQTYLRVVG